MKFMETCIVNDNNVYKYIGRCLVTTLVKYISNYIKLSWFCR